LTIISAPAGFGKTTLVYEWVAGCGRPVAWLSLDEGDSDPSRFLIYFVSALQTLALPQEHRDNVSGGARITPSIGSGLLSSLQSPQPPPTESILIALLNEITTIPNNFILVLDDYHLTDSKAVDNALSFLLEHLPPQMHLVITTREDPNLPLAQLRARAKLTELRVADLRFTPTEAGEFLNKAMGLNLSVENISALEARTEGWIAGLQLAALSMQGHQDVSGFIQSFDGDHRYIVDYLVEEVLRRQPETVRSFLLQTSVLDRLNGPLCDAVTGLPGGKARLETLQRGNFFLIPLDDKSHWYRYHHLFADVLHMHLMTEQPDQIAVLQRRASEWYEQNGLPADAIRHALAGGDFERAAGMIELAAPAMRRSRQDTTLFGWLNALPDELFRARPVLSVEYVGALLSNGQLESIEDRLLGVEQWLETTVDWCAQTEASAAGTRPATLPGAARQGKSAPHASAGESRRSSGEPSRNMIVMDEREFRRLPGLVAMYHAGLALVSGDIPGTMTHARRALDVVPEDDHVTRGGAAALLGLASWTIGDLETAHRSYIEGMAHLQKAGNISDAINGATTLAVIRIAQGRLREALHTYEQALQLATDQGAIVPRGTGDMYVGLSELHREHNDLQIATQHLHRSKELGEHAGFPQNRYRWFIAMARIRQTQGDLEGALDLLHKAETIYVSDFSPNVHPISARKVRVWVAQGRLAEALDWARENGLSAEDELGFLREFEHITLVRILLARYESDRTESAILDVIGLLERLLKAAQEGGRMGSVIEILILQALAHRAQSDIPSALIPLKQALRLAEPQGYMRIFLDEGSPMAQLLREAAERGIMPDYPGKLLVAFEAQGQASTSSTPIPNWQRQSRPASQSLIEPLSQRELEVLRLFQTDLLGPEIAIRLVVALSTVRTHTKSIYSKLNVNDRRAAVKRAAELNLI